MSVISLYNEDLKAANFSASDIRAAGSLSSDLRVASFTVIKREYKQLAKQLHPAILRKETKAYDLPMAVWHLGKHSFQQARKYVGHLATLRHDDAEVWLCLSVCCAMTEEFDDCNTALNRATVLIKKGGDDVRVKFCNALRTEKRKDFSLRIMTVIVAITIIR